MNTSIEIRSMQAAVFHAKAPWNSVDSVSEAEYMRYRIRLSGRAVGPEKDQASIDRCLCCPYSECINCIGGGTQARRGRPRKAVHA